MALPSLDGHEDAYSSRDFALSAYPTFVNISIAGLRAAVEQHIFYEDGVWLSLQNEELDELITALSYYREYRTFKPKEA